MSNDTPPDSGEPDESRPDLDAAFDAIVSNLRHGDKPQAVPPWPANEDDEVAAPAPEAQPTLGSDWSGWEDVVLPAPEPELVIPELDEHFEPPTPPPIPRGDRVARWAWAGAVGSPVVGLLLTFVGWDLSGMTGLLLVSAFLAGFGTLIARMRETRSPDDDSDNGAVV